MKISLEWIKDFVDLGDISLKDFCHKMTISGSKVEAFEDFYAKIKNVRVGQIIGIEAHPNADRLQVCQVSLGENENCEPVEIQIVTAAKNIAVGDKVPVALDKAVLYDGSVIKAGKLRDVLSQGMFCSIHELGIPSEAFPNAAKDGIFILEQDAVLGEDVLSEIGYMDSSIEFEITSNRPDCFSVEGLAREAAITFNKTLHLSEHNVVAKSDKSIKGNLKFCNQASELCPLYMARMVSNVKIKQSPLWLRQRLIKAGLRPINNIVDITNYVMLETGHPMHAFDFDKLSKSELNVRLAKNNESFKALDGRDLVLCESDLLIADGEKAVALAGVIGGDNSQVDENTATIVFEIAYFEPGQIRKTASRYGIRTESSSRFERIVDFSTTKRAMDCACRLIEELDYGDVSADYIDFNVVKDTKKEISLNTAKLNAFIGINQSSAKIRSLFEALSCEIIAERSLNEAEKANLPSIYLADAKVFTVVPPAFRPDLEGFADFAEEVARFYDYNKIEPSLLATAQTTVGQRNKEQLVLQQIKTYLVNNSYYEACFNTLTSPDIIEKMLEEIKPRFCEFFDLNIEDLKIALSDCIYLKNGAYDTSVLRTSMTVDLLKSLSLNYNRQAKTCRLFELGRTYLQIDDLAEESLAYEPQQLAIAVYDNDYGKHKEGELFYELKNRCEEVLSLLGLKNYEFKSLNDENFYEYKEYEISSKLEKAFIEQAFLFNSYRSAVVFLRKKPIAILGYLHPKFLEDFEAPANSAFLLMNMDLLLNWQNTKKTQQALPKFPASKRDLAIVLTENITWAEIQKCIKNSSLPYLESVELFDVYKGDHVPDGHKSFAFSLFFRSDKSTLTDDEVNEMQTKILTNLQKQFAASLR